jgi:hypothetical protein
MQIQDTATVHACCLAPQQHDVPCAVSATMGTVHAQAASWSSAVDVCAGKAARDLYSAYLEPISSTLAPFLMPTCTCNAKRRGRLRQCQADSQVPAS